MKKIVDFVGGLAMVGAFLAAMGAVGAYELGNIEAGQCIVRAGACFAFCFALGALNSWLMEETERGQIR